MPVNQFQTQMERHQRLAMEFLASLPAYDGSQFSGRGIVICAGGHRLFANAWVCIHMVRHLGCDLPVQLWYLGEREMDTRMEEIIRPLGASCVDGCRVAERYPSRILNGWERQ